MRKIQIVKFIIILTISFLTSCGQKKDTKTEDEINDGLKTNTLEKYRPIFEKKIIALFNDVGTDLNSNKMNFQSYANQQNISFIPFFTSKEKFLKSTEGSEGAILGNEIELSGYFFLSLISNSDSSYINHVRINPSLSDDTYLKIDELVDYYKNEIKNEIESMK